MNCNIIKDLMVLYASGECSDESKAAILEHVKTCPRCRAIWETMETGEMENAVEEEKETEFQLVTKAIKKRNWRKIFKLTAACTLILGLLLFIAGTIYVRWDNAGPDDVMTGDIVYWNEDEEWSETSVPFRYEGQDYIQLEPGNEIGKQLFNGNALPYFHVGSNWETIFKDKSKAAFNVQTDGASLWADLMLDNNRVTMYNAGSQVEENMYIDTRVNNLYIPTTSKEKVLAYYNDEDNYTWTLSEFIDTPMTDTNPEENIVERENIKLSLNKEDVEAIKDMLVSGQSVQMGSELIANMVYVYLYMTSNDGVLHGCMNLEKIDDKWYAVGEDSQTGANEYEYTTLELPKSIGDKIDRALREE